MPMGATCHVELDRGKDGETREDLIAKLQRVDAVPSVVVDSGSGGLHAYWRLSRPAPRAQVERINKALAVRLEASDRIHDISRVLRLAGTVNVKPAVMALAHVVHATGSVVDIEDLEADLEAEANAVTKQHKALPAGKVAPDHPSPVAHRVARARRYVAKMPEAVSGQEGHKATFAVAVAVVRGFIVPPQDARAVMDEYNQRCDPPWDADDLYRKIDQAYSNSTQPWGYLLAARPELEVVGGGGEPPKPEKTPSRWSGRLLTIDTLNDASNADRFLAQHADNVRYHGAFKRWFCWDGNLWRQDTEEATFASRLARGTADSIRDEAHALELAGHTEAADTVAGWWQKSLMEPRLKSMVRLASKGESVEAGMGTFDQRPMLLNVANGTIDLETGKFREHSRGDMLTQSAPVIYDPSACSDLWAQYLYTSFDGDEEMIAFIQRMTGYTLTGLTVEECLFLHHGGGRNGKGVFAATMARMLGDYSYTSDMRTFIASRDVRSGPNDDVADLQGRRAVWASESDAAHRLDEALVKSLTGGDEIRARRLYESAFLFTPIFKLHLATNHKPEIRGQDAGIWSRMRVVPWLVEVPAHKRDPDLKRKLAQPFHLSSILNWSLEGCQAWQRDGLSVPSRVSDATREYREESDILGEWLEARCIVGEHEWASSSDLYKSFKEFRREQYGEDERVMGSKTFSKALYERGFDRVKRKSRGHLGLRVRSLYER